MNWLYLKESNIFINMNLVQHVKIIGIFAEVYFCEDDSPISLHGDDADKVLEYLNRVAYA